MKAVSVIAKILTALAAVLGAVYVLATYGEKIVEWCRKVMDSLPQVTVGCDDEDEVVEAPVVEEVPVEEAPTEEEEPAQEEAPVEEEIPADVVVADEADFQE